MKILQVDNIPLAKCPTYTTFKKEDYYFAASIAYDEKWEGERDVCIYFHGASVTPPVTNEMPTSASDEYYVAREICDRGAIAIMFKNFGSKYSNGSAFSSPSPYINSYGNVNSPMFGALMVKDTWWVQSAIEFVNSEQFISLFPAAAKVSVRKLGLFGHSAGAFSVCGWAGAVGTEGIGTVDILPSFIMANAPTAAGGTRANALTRPMRVLQAVTHAVSQISIRSVIFYGTRDTYAPQDFARRVQSSLYGGRSCPVAIVNPDGASHTWLLSKTSAPEWGDLLGQLFAEHHDLTFRGHLVRFGARN